MNKCAFALKCALSGGLNQDCQCPDTKACREMVKDWCNDTYVSYPEAGPFLSPYVSMEYLRDRDWTKKKPDSLLYEGRVKCMGYQAAMNATRFYDFDETFSFYDYKLSENRLCDRSERMQVYRNYSSGSHYDIHCWNASKTLNGRPYQVSFRCQTRCISKYRVRDGIFDCYQDDELFGIKNSCPSIQHHRFQCSSSEPTCLLAGELGNRVTLCLSGHDEFDYESGIMLSERSACGYRTDSNCAYMRNYIRASSVADANKTNLTNSSSSDNNSMTTMPFRSYCNSFFNTKSAIDKLSPSCKEWICARNEYQCLSGQCISQSWICDDINNPLNLTGNRPCINLTQIGDGKIDCLSGLDERNRLKCSNMGMLGFHFLFNDNGCLAYYDLCNRKDWIPGVDTAHDTMCFYQKKHFKNGTVSDCTSEQDVMCLNDVCKKNARCNGKIECLHGEDEYRCIPQDRSQVNYRGKKIMEQSVVVTLGNYPSTEYPQHSNSTYPSLNSSLNFTAKPKPMDHATVVHEKRYSEMKSVYETVRDLLPTGTITFEAHYLPFICNRGAAVKYYTGNTVCFCPPSFNGPQCEFHSDRISVIIHLDLTNYRSSSSDQIAIIKVLTTFLFDDQIIDYYEFHINPQLHNGNNYVKQTIYFLYPRTKGFLQKKKNNRSGTQLYRVRFEAFDLHRNGTILPIGVWQYPIYFDFLPASRLSKILRFPPSIFDGPCATNPCRENGTCQEIINSNHSSYFCFCRSGYFGTHCEHYDQTCKNYCSANSICKPNYRGILTGDQSPLCLCPASTFGHACYLKNNHCLTSPCLNGGSCIITYDLANTNSYICICAHSSQGKHFFCQYPGDMVSIRIMLSNNSLVQIANIAAVTISYNNYSLPSLEFYVLHQQVYRGSLLSQLSLVYSKKLLDSAPPIAVMRVYGLDYYTKEPQYFVLYYYIDRKNINITVDLTSENFCPPVQTLQHLIRTNETSEYLDNATTAVFFYHRICRAKQNTTTPFTCFRDLNYLCICESDYYRAECFGYNRSLDRCALCLSNGYCLKGEPENETDFLCLCPRCHHGKMCQYSTELMSVTFDSLIIKDIQNDHKILSRAYISIVVLIFLFGLFNNACSFLTFIRPKPRKVSVGTYLLIVSIVDQCSLLLLLLKVIQIIIGSNGPVRNVNLYSCKIISYLLSVFTRITYWLTSFVTIDRLLMVFFPTSVTLKNLHLTLLWTCIAILVVFSMHTHELLYYTIIIDLSTSVNVTLCVPSYTDSLVSSYNRINVLLHYFIPVLIQVLAVTITVIQTDFSRARISGSHQQTFRHFFKIQFQRQKEQYIMPTIIVFSALPQAMLSFSYACTELGQSWQRYTLLTAYFLSYLPQSLGFILYVLPSSAFSREFRQTIIGKRLLQR